MDEEFRTLVGTLIHHCGTLEFLTNNAIKALGTDAVLSASAIKSPWFNRIILLRCLLHERSDLSGVDIDSLCDELDEARKCRNVVAHNPIVSKGPNETGSESILVVRHKADGIPISEKMTRKEVASLANRTGTLAGRFAELVPNATKT